MYVKQKYSSNLTGAKVIIYIYSFLIIFQYKYAIFFYRKNSKKMANKRDKTPVQNERYFFYVLYVREVMSRFVL